VTSASGDGNSGNGRASTREVGPRMIPTVEARRPEVARKYWLLVVLTALSLAACGGGATSPSLADPPAAGASADGQVTATGYGPGSSSGYGPGDGTGVGPGDGLCDQACTGPVGPDPADLHAVLDLAVQEEYRARMLYLSVLEDFGPDTRPFAAIAEAEAQHLSALTLLYERRELTPPAPLWAPSSFPAFSSRAEACAAGAAAEVADAAFYDPYLGRADLPLDVATVFSNLRAASLERHEPAFQACR
jgi:hypothetical protein